PPRKEAAAPKKGGKPLQLRYHTVMKPERVYELTVEVPKSGKPAEAAVVVLRPVVPGAQVVPAEQRLDPSEPGNRAVFHVTPLARGRLPKARVEVYAPGQPPQSVVLPMRAATQRLSWLFLA